MELSSTLAFSYGRRCIHLRSWHGLAPVLLPSDLASRQNTKTPLWRLSKHPIAFSFILEGSLTHQDLPGVWTIAVTSKSGTVLCWQHSAHLHTPRHQHRGKSPSALVVGTPQTKKPLETLPEVLFMCVNPLMPQCRII